MRKLNWSSLILDLIYIALGVVFIIHPEGVENVLCYILAAAVAVIGLMYLVGYFIQKADEHGQRQGNGFAFGILLIVMAVFIVVKQHLVIALVPFLFGVMVMIRGLMIIQGLFFMRRLGVKPLIPLVSGLVAMGFGLFVMLFPFETATLLFILIGVGLLIGGISGIIQEVLVWHTAREKAHAAERARDMEGARTVRVYEPEDVQDVTASEETAAAVEAEAETAAEKAAEPAEEKEKAAEIAEGAKAGENE